MTQISEVHRGGVPKTSGASAAARRKARIFNSGFKAGQAEVAARFARLEAEYARIYRALSTADRVIAKHGFGGLDQNPFGIRDLIGSALLPPVGAERITPEGAL